MQIGASEMEFSEVLIQWGEIGLQGDLVVPHAPEGLVIFAHGSGCSRHSSRNRAVAQLLQQNGLATLLFDLLTEEEERLESYTHHLRFNIPLLAERLTDATNWVAAQENLQNLPIGYFGASTGTAAALVAAAELGQRIGAVVSRGGRPDLADAALGKVAVPTLLIVGGRDVLVTEVNRRAYGYLRCEKRITIVAGATHFFEEPGALEQVARLASEWFLKHLHAVKAFPS